MCNFFGLIYQSLYETSKYDGEYQHVNNKSRLADGNQPGSVGASGVLQSCSLSPQPPLSLSQLAPGGDTDVAG